MTKNSGRKKAARKYQQEHPGTTFPEAMRAVARPTAETFSMPDGYILLDQEGVPTTFDPVAYTADLNASLLTSGTSELLFLQADGVQLTPEQSEAMALHQAEMLRSFAETVREKWRRSNTATAEAQASANDLRQPRTPEELDAEMGVDSSADRPRTIGLHKFGGADLAEAERAQVASRDAGGENEWAKLQRFLDPRMAELIRSRLSSPAANLGRHNGVIQVMTTHTGEDRPAT